MAALIRRFVSGDVTPYDWDDLMGIKFGDPWVEQVRIRATTTADAFPAGSKTGCDEGQHDCSKLRSISEKKGCQLAGEMISPTLSRWRPAEMEMWPP
jgi:hypothetical protein